MSQSTDPVRHVSRERWQEAQRWELEFWKDAQRKHGWKRVVWPLAAPALRALNWSRAWGDDWNRWWSDQFDGYSFLPAHLGDCVELGCGPYTNIRLALEGRTANRVVCSDPLVRSYLEFRGRWLAHAHEAGLVEVDDHPIEQSAFPPESFDLVVMINVLDHVHDADACMEKAISLVRKGGSFVLGQDLSNADDLKHHPYDVGHPIRLRREDLEPFLEPLTTLHRRDLPREAGRDPRLHYATLVYAGRKG